ncbi:MAG: RNA-binding protein [Lachnospiraceae bacterium]|nr:RNA-binding protein [Lachnospiraceae bacterium]
MIELGKRQMLTIVKIAEHGAYLADTVNKDTDPESEESRVLLPKKELPEDAMYMDPIDVFIYRDSKDRLIATTREPLIKLGEVSALKVKDVSNIGAFLDWGLEKDLFLPFKEQKEKVSKGDVVPVRLYVDKSKRLCATMWVKGDEKKTGDYLKNATLLTEILEKNGGALSVGDKSSPEKIMKMTGMSKNEFKKAAGNLYKQRLVRITEDSIELIKDNKR